MKHYDMMIHGIFTGIIGTTIARLFGYNIDSLGFWVIALSIMAVLNALYILAKD